MDDQVMSLSALSLRLRAEFQSGGGITLLHQAIAAAEGAVDAAPPTDDRMPELRTNLALLLNDLARVTGEQSAAARALELARTALDALGPEDDRRWGMSTNLGYELVGAFARDGDRATLEEALTRCRAAVSGSPADDPNRRIYLTNLALALSVLADEEGTVSAAAEAVEASRQALAVTPPGHRDRPRNLSNLQSNILRLSTVSGDLELLVEALEVGTEAVEATPRGDPERAFRLSNLANLYQHLDSRTERPDALAQAVRLARQAAEEIPPGHVQRAAILNNLAVKLRQWHARGAGIAILHESIERSRAAVDAAGRPGRAEFQFNLGMALLDLFHVTGRSDVLAESAGLQEEVARQAPPGLIRGRFQVGLAATLLALHRRSGRRDPLDQAVTAARSATAEIPADHPMSGPAHAHLAEALRAKYRATADPAALASATSAARIAVEHADTGVQKGLYLANLGAMMLPVGSTVSEPDLREAEGHLRAAETLLPAGHPERAAALTILARVLLAGPDASDRAAEAAEIAAEAARLDAVPQILVGAARTWGRAATLAGDRSMALTAYALAVRQSTLVASEDLDRGDREFGLGAMNGLPGEAAAAALSNGLPDRAVELLESSRGVLFRQLIDDRAAAPAAELVSPAGPVIILTADDERCDALVVAGPGTAVRHIPLPDVTEELVMAQANRLLALTGPAADPAPAYPELQRLRAGALEVLAWLWDAITERVLDTVALPTGTRIWWCPVGAMAFLPWHAAGHHGPGMDGRSVVDRVVSSYTPTLRALHYARRPLQAELPALVVGVEDRLLRAAEEAALVHDRLPGAVRLSEARHDAVLERLPQHGLVHLACHCVSDWTVPSDSRLELADRPVTVTDLASLDLPNAGLAYLSACATSRTNLRLVDESVHVTAGFLMAGFRQVVGTWWPVPDRTAVDVADIFYTALGAHADQAAVALHHAVRTIRDQDPRAVLRWAGWVHAGA